MIEEQANAARINWLILFAAFAASVVVLLARYFINVETSPLISDTDDAMRLVVVRDFLNGQGWFDNVQHRLNTPFGAEIHWSRLIDLPIAGLVLLARPFAGASAEMVAAFIWPLILLFVLLAVSAKLCVRLIGRDGTLPGVLLPVFSPSILAEFTPGRVDHHNVQLILALVTVYCTIEALKRPAFAIGAGIACATALTIGTESIATVAAAIIAFGFIWIASPARATALRDFGLSYAGASLVHLAIAQPPSRWFEPACDALSIVYVTAAIIVALAFVLLSYAPVRDKPVWLRLVLGGGVGLISLATLALLFPECRNGPYGQVDPWLVEHWIDNIIEARPVWESLIALPAFTVASLVPPIVGLIIVGYHVIKVRDGRTPEWAMLGLFLALAFVVMVVQVRGARTAGIIAIPAGAWLIVTAREHYIARSRPFQVAGLIGSWLLFAGAAISVVVLFAGTLLPGGGAAGDGERRGDRDACLVPQAFVDLAGLPPERLMTPIDLGSHMLLFTPHSVVSAPYHRNQRGVLDTFHFFNWPIEEARAILDERGISLVVTCPGMPEMRGQPDASPDSFVRLAEKNALPSWLREVTLPGAPLRTYEVLPR